MLTKYATIRTKIIKKLNGSIVDNPNNKPAVTILSENKNLRLRIRKKSWIIEVFADK
jgi:hypothetical protein